MGRELVAYVSPPFGKSVSGRKQRMTLGRSSESKHVNKIVRSTTFCLLGNHSLNKQIPFSNLKAKKMLSVIIDSSDLFQRRGSPCQWR